MDDENWALCLRFPFERLASLSHSAGCLVMGMPLKPETVPQTVYDIVLKFPITLTII